MKSRLLAAEALALVAFARLALAVLPLRFVQGLLPAVAAGFPRRRLSADQAVMFVAWAVAAASRRTPGANCLPDALAAHAMLRRRGVASRLRFGVRPPGTSISAHAWLEHRGRVVVGDLEDLARFRQLAPARDRISGGVASLLRGETLHWADLATTPAAFLETLAAEDLTALAYHAAQGANTDWPAEVSRGLAEAARGAVSVELARTHETRRVLDALAAAGVRPLLFKGTALAHSAYPQPALRPRNDTDLLIRPGDRAATGAALRALGYQEPVYCTGEVLFRQFELQRRDEFGVLHAFDIHWALSTQALFAELFTYDDLSPPAVPIPALGNNARAFGPVEALLWSCVHPAMHHRNEERLIWVHDTHLLAGALRPTDWERFTDLAVSRRVAALCAEGLARAAARLGTAIPADVLARLDSAGAEPSARYLDGQRSWADEVASSLTAMGWHDRLRLAREVAFPAPRYMLASYGMSGAPLGPVLLPVLYVHRGARGAWRVLAGRK